MHAPSAHDERTYQLGTLCFGGDWACAHGDVSGLRHVARQLAAMLRQPFQGELLELAEECHRDAERATRTWSLLKGRLVTDRRPRPEPSPSVHRPRGAAWQRHA